jgi:hypothetical protein
MYCGGHWIVHGGEFPKGPKAVHSSTKRDRQDRDGMPFIAGVASSLVSTLTEKLLQQRKGVKLQSLAAVYITWLRYTIVEVRKVGGQSLVFSPMIPVRWSSSSCSS